MLHYCTMGSIDNSLVYTDILGAIPERYIVRCNQIFANLMQKVCNNLRKALFYAVHASSEQISPITEKEKINVKKLAETFVETGLLKKEDIFPLLT